MSYVTTVGAVAATGVRTVSTSAIAPRTTTTTKTSTTSPAAAAAAAALSVVTRPSVRPTVPKPVVFTGAGIAPAADHTALIAGGAVAVGLLIVLALRRG